MVVIEDKYNGYKVLYIESGDGISTTPPGIIGAYDLVLHDNGKSTIIIKNRFGPVGPTRSGVRLNDDKLSLKKVR